MQLIKVQEQKLLKAGDNMGTWLNIVIVAWRGGAELVAAVSGLIDAWPHGARTRTLITVVDNGGNEGVLNELTNRYALKNPNAMLRILGDGTNLGFARACNLGAFSVSSEYTVVMNSDVYSDPANMLRLVEVLEHHSEVKVVGPQLTRENGEIWRSCTYTPTVNSLIFAPIIGPFWSKISRSGRFMSEWEHSDQREVDQVIGALMCFRTGDFRALGGFDEQFFVYYEEVDYCFRVKNCGGYVVYVPSSKAIHVGGASSGSDIKRRVFYGTRSRYLYSKKHFGSGVGIVVALSSAVAELLIKPTSLVSRGRFRRGLQGFCGAIKFIRWFITYAQGSVWRASTARSE